MSVMAPASTMKQWTGVGACTTSARTSRWNSVSLEAQGDLAAKGAQS
ncbi:MAG TPA: hypothetical protein VK580_08405 [Steroidobacteraceae bacterium]|nr:hypothetical protein [Steroidobacteraceae bacterium]